MFKHFLFALSLALPLLVAGCAESTYQSSNNRTSSRSSSTQAAVSTPAPAPQPTYQRTRNSTTQILPAGYGYLHEQDLTGGRLVANSTVPMIVTAVQQPQPQPQAKVQSRGGN